MPIIPGNQRERWSRITDTSILRPRDELRLVGVSLGPLAIIGVLDSHDPSADPVLVAAGLARRRMPPPHHHHILVQLDGGDEVVSAALFVGSGELDTLLTPHVAPTQRNDAVFAELQNRVHDVLESDRLGLYFLSDQERLSATPQGRAYLNDQGGLLIHHPQ